MPLVTCPPEKLLSEFSLKEASKRPSRNADPPGDKRVENPMMFPFGGVPKTGYVEFMFEFKAKIENPDSRGVGPRGADLEILESCFLLYGLL